MSENETTPESIRPGMLFCDRYRIERRLDDGGMATVYLAVDESSGLPVAIKVLFIRYSDNSVVRARFLDEGRIQAMLQHPNIVHVYRIIPDPVLSFVMEYIDGESLEDYLQREGPLDETEIVDLMMPVMSAVGFAHSKGIVHRDIKPSNILLKGGSGHLEPKVMDFGVAKVNRGKELTAAGTTVGTLHYMSPEQIVGARDIDGRADIYSLGCSLYKLCTGEVPFNASSEFALMMAQVEAVPTPPSDLRPEISQTLEAVILRALAKEPENRFQSIKEMTSALMKAGSLDEKGDTSTRPIPGDILQFAMDADEVARDQSEEFRLETLVLEESDDPDDTETIELDANDATMTHELSTSALLQIERDRLEGSTRQTKKTAERPMIERSDLLTMQTVERDAVRRDRLDDATGDADSAETVEQDAYEKLDPDSAATIEQDAVRRQNFSRSIKRDDVARRIRERIQKTQQENETRERIFDDLITPGSEDSRESDPDAGLATTTERSKPDMQAHLRTSDDQKLDLTRKVPYPRPSKSSNKISVDNSDDETVDLSDFVSRDRLSDAFAATEKLDDDQDDETVSLGRDDFNQNPAAMSRDTENDELTHRVARSDIGDPNNKARSSNVSAPMDLRQLGPSTPSVNRSEFSDDDGDATSKQIPSVRASDEMEPTTNKISSVRVADDVDATVEQIPSARGQSDPDPDSTAQQIPSARGKKRPELKSTAKEIPSSRKRSKLDSTAKQRPSLRNRQNIDSGSNQLPPQRNKRSPRSRRSTASRQNHSGPSAKTPREKRPRKKRPPKKRPPPEKQRSSTSTPSSRLADIDNLELPPKPQKQQRTSPAKLNTSVDDVDDLEPRVEFRRREATAHHGVDNDSPSESIWIAAGIIAVILAVVIFLVALYLN